MNALRGLTLATLIPFLLNPHANAADLEVIVTGVRQTAGNIRIAVWTTPDSFLTTAFREAAVAIPDGANSVRLRFSDLPAGMIAASAFHDLNGNQRLDTGFAGIPKEPYGFSRGARGRFGPPSFREACVTLAETLTTIEIRLE